MVGHAVPGVVGLQNLHRHLALLQQLTDEDGDQILGFLRITRYFFLEKLFESVLQYIQKIRSQAPHIHGDQRIHVDCHTIYLCSICSLYDVLGLHNLSQVVILVHLADTTSHTAIIRQGILQHKASHARLTAIYQILVDGLEAFFAIVIICIDHNERGIDYFLRCKHGLSSSPRLCTSFRQSSRNIVNVLKSVIHSYIMSRANSCDTITDDLFEFLLDILTDNKYYMVEASLNCIMNGIIHDGMSSIIHWLQLLNSCSETATDTSSHDK